MCNQPHKEQIKNYLRQQFNLPDDQIDLMIPGFLKTLGSHMETIEAAQRSGDLEGLGKAGHTMKGALLNLGLLDCADIALSIETGGRAEKRHLNYADLVISLRQKLEPYIAAGCR